MTKPSNKYGLLLGAALCALSSPAFTADLGGNCCADLEERIAELEATTARKGNRKVSVNVYGQVNKGILFYDIEGEQDQQVIDNGSDPSRIGVAGTAKINGDWSAGYVLEVGVGGYDINSFALGAATGDTNAIYLHKSFGWVKGPIGALSVGLASQATDDLDAVTTANTTVAVRPLSLRPLTGPQVLEALDLFDGNRGNIVRYDSPTFAGFTASASWGAGEGLNDGDDVWDAALRYQGEFSGFKLTGAVGYREGVIVNQDGTSIVLNFGNDFELSTLTAVGSVMHMQSGLFATATYGKGEGTIFGNDFDTEGLSIQAGLEQKFTALGKTTLFGEYGQVTIDGPGGFNVIDLDYYGGGIVQNIDAAAMSVYLSIRQYSEDDILTDDATVGIVGAKIGF